MNHKGPHSNNSHSNSRHNRKRSNGQKKLYQTKNFMNSTMAQINQGKNTELFPLVDHRKKNANYGLKSNHSQ